MWEPDPGWTPVGTPGRSGAGLWLAQAGGDTWVVKRLARPVPGESPELEDPGHSGYWRREADVALDGVVGDTAGLRAPVFRRVDEDEFGITLWQAAVDQDPESNGLFRAHALGRFAGQELPARGWYARGLLAERIAAQERRGGWRTLARTTVADLADLLWLRRGGLLARLAALPHGPAHGDATPANLRGRVGNEVLAVDWGTLGLAPVGTDVGYLALSEREHFDVLVAAYCQGLPAADPVAVAYAARLTAVFSAFNRAEWTLARVAVGQGALAGKYRHPAVRPALASLQRLLPQADALLDSWNG